MNIALRGGAFRYKIVEAPSTPGEGMDRRRFVALIGSALAAPLVRAQSQPATRPLRVGWLSTIAKGEFPQFISAFRDGMAALGYVEGKNLLLDDRWDESVEGAEHSAADLVALKPVAIVTAGTAIRAAAKHASTVPIVFGLSGSPLDAGWSSSFARPDRNMTGMSFMALDLVGKRIEFLKEVLPGMRRLAVLSNQLHVGEPREFAVTREASDRLGITLSYHPFKGVPEIEQGLAAALAANADAGVVFPDASMMARSATFAQFSLRHRIPLISGWAAFADGGNVLSYGPELRASWRRLAYFVDRIAKGAKVADLPIELPTTVEMVVNLKTAKALGIRVPQVVLLRADRVIE
jgi:putative ABC transport system substrate-binding protein